mgnify:CR=1 FL=1
MEKLKLKATAEAFAILLGFFVFGILVSFLFDEATAELFRLLILEWGAFPMLCAICGGVVSMKNGFMPLYGIFAGAVFLPFMFLFFETNWGFAAAYVIFGALTVASAMNFLVPVVEDFALIKYIWLINLYISILAKCILKFILVFILEVASSALCSGISLLASIYDFNACL